MAVTRFGPGYPPKVFGVGYPAVTMPLGVVWFVLLNGGIYALVGVAIELIRRAHLYR